MAIEIRNLSITSKVVQRQASDPAAGTAQQQDACGSSQRAPGMPADWRIECRRMIQELLELQRER